MPSRSMRHRVRRGGFTLLEVIVALAVSGVVLLGARALLEAVADDAHRVVALGARADAEANGDRLLRALVGRTEVGTQQGGEFGGSGRAARFTSWCDVPAGWQEHCTVTLAVDSLAGAGPVLVAVLDYWSNGAARREVVPLKRGFARGMLRYLADVSAGGTWFQSWGEGITAPAALGVILDADTLIVRIGERG